MKKHAVLVQTHKPIDYFLALAARYPSVNFYVHFDKKCDDSLIKINQNLPNVTILTDRVSVIWGGFSQVQATLNLFAAAFANADNQFFHLVSGEDVLLQDFATLEKVWQHDFNFAVMMTCKLAPQYAYRFIMDSPHADSHWQRNLSGKLLTKFQQGLAKVKTYNRPVYFGSQWFSITRQDWAKILPFVDDYCQFFARKLVPDEHFFQTLVMEKRVREKTNVTIANNNKRLIVFDKTVNNGNSPLYLDLPQLERAKFDGLWFARKVTKDVALNWLGELT